MGGRHPGLLGQAAVVGLPEAVAGDEDGGADGDAWADPLAVTVPARSMPGHERERAQHLALAGDRRARPCS